MFGQTNSGRFGLSEGLNILNPTAAVNDGLMKQSLRLGDSHQK
jgi:hypothetical protein